MMRLFLFRGHHGTGQRFHTLRQRPLAAFVSRAVQLAMLTGIVAVGLLSLGLVVATAVVFGFYAVLRKLAGKSSGNFRIQFASGR